MFCKNCGKEIEPGAKFCKECGAPVEAPAQPQAGPEIIPEVKPKKAKKPFYKRWWFWVIVAILVLGSCGQSGSKTNGEETPSAVATKPKEEDTTAVTSKTELKPSETTVPADNSTTGEKNALKKAKNYLSFTAFSRTGLIAQLEYEGFSNAEATYAVDKCGADWKEQAEKKAKSYLQISAFSKKGLVEQLEYEGFTSDEATHGVDNCGADWKDQAAKKAKSYLELSSFSRSSLIDQLVFEGFTTEQAEYGASQNGY